MVEQAHFLRRSAWLRCAATVMRIAIPAVIAGGCSDATLSSGPSAEPFLYLVISSAPMPVRFPSPSDTAIKSLLLTAGSAAGATFRSAQHFALTDEADGTTFTFTESTAPAAVPGVGRNGATLEDGNFLLPYSTTQTSVGASALRPLGIYDLRIETEGRVITGRLLIPDRPQPSIVEDGAKRFVTFPEVPGAAAYLVGGDTELYQHIITSNQIQLLYDVDPAFVPPNPEFRVVALDSNLVRYMSDSTQSSVGIEGALGLFGAINSARIPVPWP
jgi:hypothetical protein